MPVERIRTFLRRRADTPIPDRRKAEREPCSIPAYLFDAAGIASTAKILDRSKTGVRVSCAESDFHSKARYILRLDTGAAYRLRIAWYTPLVAGYEFKRRVDGSGTSTNRAVMMIHATWCEYQAARFSEE